MQKILLYALLVLALLIGSAWFYVTNFMPRQRPPLDVQIEVTPELLARGSYLVEHVLLCNDCHSERGWTDGDIIRATREGVDHQGLGLFPIMPYFIYRNMSDGDAEAVVAYMRNLTAVRKEAFIARFKEFSAPKPVARLEDNTLMNWSAY